MTPALFEVLVNEACRMQQIATQHPVEGSRAEADKRLNGALEAVLGMPWSILDRMVLVYMIKPPHPGDVAASVPEVLEKYPNLVGHEDKIRAALDGAAVGDRVWPPMVALLEAAGLLEIEGGNAKALKSRRKSAAETLATTWRKRSAEWERLFNPPPTPGS
jgi:hypothetical protein